MLESLINIIAALFMDLPKLFLYILVLGGISYTAALILIGFPVSIWEAITKKKTNEERENKITFIVSICVFVLLILRLLFEETH